MKFGALDVHLDDQRLAGDRELVVETNLADPVRGDARRLLGRLVRMRDPGFAAVVFAGLHQRDFAGLGADRAGQYAHLAGQRVGVQVRQQVRVIAGIGLERDHLRSDALEGEQDAVNTRIRADVEKIIGPARLADARHVFELIALPDAEPGDRPVDQISCVHHEQRALRAHNMNPVAEQAHGFRIELAQGVLHPADRIAEISGGHRLLPVRKH
jgi:hypothetical protein